MSNKILNRNKALKAIRATYQIKGFSTEILFTMINGILSQVFLMRI